MNSKKIIYQILATLFFALLFVGAATFWKVDIVKKIYFNDWLTVVLNGFILMLFITGIVKLIFVLRHYAYEEMQIALFARAKESSDENVLRRVSLDSLIYNRYATIKKLYEQKAPINHGAIASIMIADESTYLSYPKFVNNVLILTGVFGTILSLILALVGASTILESTSADKGINIMLLGMNTALTTTATAIVCFFFFTFFYQKLTDAQTHVFSKVENAAMMYIVPEFSFDMDTVNFKTEQLVKNLKELIVNELRDLIVELKRGASYVENTLSGIDAYNTQNLKKMDIFISQQTNHIEKIDDLLNSLDNVRAILRDGFRLPN